MSIGLKTYKTMATIMDQQQKWLLKKFHTLCTKLGMKDFEKRALIESFGVESSKDLDNHQLIDLVHTLEMKVNPKAGEGDQLRKRVIAAIGGWLRVSGREESLDLIKGIACRATGYDSFNKIPNERLRNIYCAFSKKTQDQKKINEITDNFFVQMLSGDLPKPNSKTLN